MKIKLSNINLLRLFNLEGFQKTSIYFISLAIFVVLNFLLSYLSFRLDFSSGKAHTLSSSTKKIIRELDDIVNIKVFISSDLPVRLLPLKTEVLDLINEYQKQAKGKIIVKKLDPKKDGKALDEARSLGVPELQFSQIEKDKYAVSATYFGIGVQYGTKTEVIPQATNLETLEYDITSAIYKITRREPIKIGVLGASEFANIQEDEFYTIKKILQQQFELDFSQKLDSSLKTVLVFDNSQKPYATSEAEMINNYLNGGGKAIFLIDGVYVEKGLTTRPADHNLFSIFEDYGLKLNKNLVLSYSSEMASFTTGLVSFFTPYPFWIKTNNFSSQSSVFFNVGTLIFPWVSSVEISKKQGIEARVLVASEKNSWEQKENFILNPNNIPEPSKNDLKEFNLIVEGKKKNAGQLIIIPCSRFVKEGFLSQARGNIAFLINLINHYASEGALSGIRSRAFYIAPIADVSEGTKDIVKYLNILLLPVATGIIGGIKLIKRR